MANQNATTVRSGLIFDAACEIGTIADHLPEVIGKASAAHTCIMIGLTLIERVQHLAEAICECAQNEFADDPETLAKFNRLINRSAYPAAGAEVAR